MAWGVRPWHSVCPSVCVQVAGEYGMVRVVSETEVLQGKDYCVLYNPQWAPLPHDLSKAVSTPGPDGPNSMWCIHFLFMQMRTRVPVCVCVQGLLCAHVCWRGVPHLCVVVCVCACTRHFLCSWYRGAPSSPAAWAPQMGGVLAGAPTGLTQGASSRSPSCDCTTGPARCSARLQTCQLMASATSSPWWPAGTAPSMRK